MKIHITKALSLILAIILCISLFSSVTLAAAEGGYTYSIQNNGAVITGADASVSGEVVIPSELGGYSVTALGDYAFQDNGTITSLVIPEGVETIGNYCFDHCYNLEELWLPSTLTSAGKFAFDDCYVYKLHIADIACYAQVDFSLYYGNPFDYFDEELEDWEDGRKKTLYVGNGTEPVTEIVISEGVTKINKYAFSYHTYLQSVVLPDSLKEIDERAFTDCVALRTVEFGAGLLHIGKSAFSGCESLGNLTLPANLETIGEWAFSSNNAMTEITIPDKVDEIPTGAFSYCEALETVNLGAAVERIGQQSFQNTGLTEIIIPDNVKTIDIRAFSECKNLETAVIGDGVTTVADKIFYGCTSLKNLTLGNALTTYPENFLKLQDKYEPNHIKEDWLHIEKLVIGDGITALPTEVIRREYLQEIEVGNGITEIADAQFTNFDRLESVILGDNVTAIGDNAFYRCTNLSRLRLPANLETIGVDAFRICSSLTEIVIPAKVISIGDGAFGACSKAESITFEGTALRRIGNWAFSECSSLTAVTIPEGVTHVGSSLFYWSENLHEINLPDSLISIKSGLIQYTPYDDDYDYDEDMLYIGNHLITAGYYQTSEKYVVRKGTVSIAQYAFSNEHSLETVVIHKGLVSMDDDIFNDCPNLTQIGFTGTEAEWEQIAKGNNDFSDYTIEFNYYVCPHVNTENKAAVASDCYSYGYTEGIYCNDCDEWLRGHKQLAKSHKDNDGDAVCDVCETRVSDITIDEKITLPAVDFGHELKFVAPATGEYTITSYSEGATDPYVDLYDSEYRWLASNDEQDGDYSNDNYDFRLTYTLEKGKTYVFSVTSLCSDEIGVLLTFDCEHTGGTATCTQKALCTICGLRYGSPDTDNHTALSVLKAKTATCTKTGLTEGKRCTACGVIVVAQKSISKQNHTYRNGTCSVCGKKDPSAIPASNPFGDVKKSDYYCTPVLWAVENNITAGTSATTFAPEEFCTRAQVVTFLWRAAGQPSPKSSQNPFSDVAGNQYFSKAVLWAVEKNITSGVDATHFAPDDTCTRGQIVAFLYRFAGNPKVSGNTPFNDVSKKQYYYKPVLWAVNNGVTTGTSATTFSPENTCTRAQVVTFLYRVANQ